MIKRPFYGIFLSALHKSWSDKIETACIVFNKNQTMSLLINESFWLSLNEDQRIALLEHEVLHVCHYHNVLYKDYSDRRLFNIAADMEINQYVQNIEVLQDYVNVYKYRDKDGHPFPINAGTRKYYELLKELDSTKNQDFKHYWELSEDADNLTDELKRTIIESNIIQSADTLEKTIGNIPGHIEDMLEIIRNRKQSFDWKVYLRNFANNRFSTKVKVTRRRESKRYDGGPAIKKKRKSKVLVAIDTSGSVSQDELNIFLTEIDHIAKNNVEIELMQFDCIIQDKRMYNKSDAIKIHGRGGTDFQKVVDYYEENNKEYNSLIIFTDGFAGKPTSKFNSQKILFVITPNGTSIPNYNNIKLNEQ